MFSPGQEVSDKGRSLPAIKDVVYAGHYQERMSQLLSEYRGEFTPELLMSTVIPNIAMPSNFQDVVYDPVSLRFWVSNARSKDERAADQPYTFFDFGAILRNLGPQTGEASIATR